MPHILKTKRLTLRQFTLQDTGFVVALLNSPGWLKFIGDRNVKGEAQAKEYLLNGPLKSYLENGFGLSLVETIKEKTPVGMCGLIKRDKLENPDIGFAFLPEHTGNGYAIEMVSAVLHHATKISGFNVVSAITLPTNQGSINVLKKAGFVFEKMFSMTAESEELMLFGYKT